MKAKLLQCAIGFCLLLLLNPGRSGAEDTLAKDKLAEAFATAHATIASAKYEQAAREYEKAFIFGGRDDGEKMVFDDAAADRINTDLDVLEKNLNGTAIVLNLRGRMLLAQGKNIEAIQTLEKARKLVGESKKKLDGELLFALAQGYFAEGETGSAKKICEQILGELDTFKRPRVMLVHILLDTNKIDDAEPHLRVLEALAPKDPSVIDLRLKYYVLRDELDKARSSWNKLPADTTNDRATKSKAAIDIAKGHIGLRETAKAKAIIEKALKIDPDNADLLALKSEIAGGKSLSK